MASNPVSGKHSKHIELRYHHTRENVKNGLVSIFHVPSAFNRADIGTKPLRAPTFRFLRDRIVHDNIHSSVTLLPEEEEFFKKNPPAPFL